MKRLYYILILLSILNVFVYSAEFNILFTGSFNGHLDGCYCSSDPKGGVVTLAPFIFSFLKENKNTLLFSTGDILSPSAPSKLNDFTQKASKYIFKAMRYLPYDAIVMGDQDLTKGVSFFLNEAKKLPYLNANVLLKSSSKDVSFGKEYIIKEIEGVRIAVIAYTSKNVFKYFFTPSKMKIKSKVKINDNIKMLSDKIKSISSKADVIILLSHSGYNEDVEILKDIKDIDLIIGGHDTYMPLKVSSDGAYLHPPVLIPKLYNVEGRYIFQSGKNGLYAGLLKLRYKNGKLSLKDVIYKRINYGEKLSKDTYKKADIKCNIISEDDHYYYCKGAPKDPKIKEWIKELRRR